MLRTFVHDLTLHVCPFSSCCVAHYLTTFPLNAGAAEENAAEVVTATDDVLTGLDVMLAGRADVQSDQPAVDVAQFDAQIDTFDVLADQIDVSLLPTTTFNA